MSCWRQKNMVRIGNKKREQETCYHFLSEPVESYFCRCKFFLSFISGNEKFQEMDGKNRTIKDPKRQKVCKTLLATWDWAKYYSRVIIMMWCRYNFERKFMLIIFNLLGQWHKQDKSV